MLMWTFFMKWVAGVVKTCSGRSKTVPPIRMPTPVALPRTPTTLQAKDLRLAPQGLVRGGIPPSDQYYNATS